MRVKDRVSYKIMYNYLTSGFVFDKDDPRLPRLMFLNGINLLGMIIFVSISMINLLIKDYPWFVFEFAIFLMLFFSVFYIRKTGKTKLPIALGVLVNVIMALDNILIGGFNNTGILWIYPFPAIAFFLVGRKKGLLSTAFLLLVFILLYAFHALDLLALPYSDFTLQMFLVTFIVTSMLFYFYQLSIERGNNLILRQSITLRNANKRLEEEVRERKKYSEELKKEKEEFENLNKLMIGRELRINELKKKMAQIYKGNGRKS